jgi:CDP-4-dehydro-6-deoxyglucose reductase, E3
MRSILFCLADPMSFTVTLQPGGRTLAIDPGTTLLQAALDAELLVPYGCRDGACGACKAKVLSGEIDHGKAPQTTLPEAERSVGMTLLCCAHAHSDVTVECREVRSAHDIPVRKMPCRVQSLEKLAPEVMMLKLRLPTGDRFHFLPGQYIDFLLSDGQRRSFSIANTPNQDNTLELHVRLIPGGQFSGHVFSAMKARDILRIEGPLGSFFLRDQGNAEEAKPVIFLAGGTGFGPIKAIIEDMIARNIQRPIALYRGVRDTEDLYLSHLPEHWSRQLDNFSYTNVISGDTPEGWTGRSGMVHQAVMEDIPDLSGHEVYACGSPAMIEAAKKDFSEHGGLPLTSFYADAFIFSAVPQT